MKYQVNTVMMFDLEDDAVAFINLVEQLKDKVCTDRFEGGINNDLVCNLFKCYHDELPPKQCEQIDYVDFKGEKLEKKNSKDKVITYNSVNVKTKEKV